MGDSRGSSSLFRRAEQLRRWQESETNKTEIKQRNKKVTFSDGCIFLAAGAAGDRDELLRLLQKGADINTVNQDGITALHAACIDNNMEIVEFLVDHGADINRCDMEGWTPLHATASCGSCTMAKFLIDRGADLSLVNNDGELPIDVVDDDDMSSLLQLEMDIRNIDCDASRSREERQMLNDVQIWIKSGVYSDVPHPKTGASALHVASAKGYIKVLRLLIEAGCDVNFSDVDGWSPLHAAAHWGQKEAAELLCDNSADMEAVNYVGQTPHDLSDDSMKPLMEELKRRQEKLKTRNKANRSVKRRKSPQGERSVKKKEDTQSDGTSSDESTSDDKVQSPTPQNRLEPSVDEKEVQSWRRASSLRNRTHQEDKNQKEEANRTSYTSSRLNNKENEEVPLRRGGSLANKDDKNCELAVHRVSEPIISLNTSTTSRAITRAFAPPSRDDESETQRKAHAKMVRSTRRSTQGVSLEDIKSAEQLMKNKPPPPPSTVPVTDQNSFSLEDTRLKENKKAEDVPNDTETPTVTIQIRKKNTEEKKEEEQDNGDRKSQTREGTQAAIQRKKKPKRRSTGVVHVDLDEIDQERRAQRESEKAQGEDDPGDVSSTDKDGTKGSSVSLNSSRPASRASSVATENGDIDYKKLYEEQLAENDKLMEKMRIYEKEVKQSRDTIDNNNKQAMIRQAQAESEKREKRGLERKLSEMEEELRNQEQLRQENQRLRDENGALIRVISKLSR